MLEMDPDKMLFTIKKEQQTKEILTELLKAHPEVKFVSFAGLDIAALLCKSAALRMLT